MNNIFFYIACFFYLLSFTLCPQKTAAQDKLTLFQVVELAKKQSPAAKLASTSFINKYWGYKNYSSNYKPQLALNGTLPDLTRSYLSVIQDDVTEEFKLRSLSNSSLELSLNQNIGLTGGSLFLSSQLQRLDILNAPKNVSYLANPVLIGIQQPLFRFNALKWDKKIEPLKYEEARREYSQEMENVSLRASELFFNLLVAQISLDIQQKNLTNNDTLYKISQGRYKVGKIAENDLLQMELSLMNAKNNLTQAQLDVELSVLQLKTFLTLEKTQNIELIAPPVIPQFEIDEQVALYQAKQNTQQMIELKRLRLEAERDVEAAKGNTRLNANLFASYGLTQSASLFNNLYINPQEQERLRLGFEIPILDWGKGKAQIQTAKANRELMEVNLQQAEQNFDQEIYLLVKQVKMQREKFFIAAKADTIAQKRYDISIQRYTIGKIAITDLNIAQQEKDQAKLEYLQSLQRLWRFYYELRQKTLYDFEKNEPIYYEALQ